METKIVNSKLHTTEHESGVARMRALDVYFLLIDEFRYPVEKELYESVSEGDEVYFHIAPKSNELIRITLKWKYH